MPVELVVPSVGESITQVEIGDWLKAPGEAVHQDEPVVVIETDKVTVELPAPATGPITKMLKKKGEKAAVGDVIGYRDPNGAGKREPEKPKESAKPKAAEHAPAKTPDAKAPPSIPQPTGREQQIVPMTPIR